MSLVINAPPQLPKAPELPLDEEDTLSKTLKIEYNQSLVPIQQVKVYTQSAQVFRTITLTLDNKEQEIIIVDVPNTIADDSVRANVIGDAMISEVYQSQKSIRILNDQTTRETIHKEMQQLIDERKGYESEIERLNKEDTFLVDYSNSIIGNDRPNKDLEELVTATTISTMTDFLAYFRENTERIDSARCKLKKMVVEINYKLSVLNTTFKKEKNPVETKILNCINILIQPTTKEAEKMEITLDLDYIVNGCFWKSSYDVRRSTTQPTIDISYFGNVTQCTKEDWTNVSLSLSTADPSKGNAPPKLDGLSVGFFVQRYGSSVSSLSGGLMDSKKMKQSSSSRREEKSEESMITEEEKPMMMQQTAQAEQSMTSSSFLIPNKTTIPSDGDSHRVTIAVLQFKCELVYFAIPRLEQKSYVKCTAVNTSQYPFVEGISSIFVDNQFIGKGKIATVATNEKFETFLGVDPSLKIEYRPPQRFKEQKGWIKGTNKMNVERRFTIKNTRPETVKIIVHEQVPLSQNPKNIVVDLVEPLIEDFGKMKDPILNYKVNGHVIEKLAKNDLNNLEYTITIDAGKEVAIPLKYMVSWPASQQITPDY